MTANARRTAPPCRLCLIAPAPIDPLVFAPQLEAALDAGDVACLILPQAGSPAAMQRVAEIVVPIAQTRGVATLIADDTRVAARTRADGVHIERGIDDVRSAIESFHPDRIVGVGGVYSRHDAMLAGERGPDYVLFGRLGGDDQDRIPEAMLDLATWWCEIVEVPAMVMGSRLLASAPAAAATGAEFVALGRAVWGDPRGAAYAIAEANRLLLRPVEVPLP
ncbi:MAG: thiamine phosphate synthase [Bauldia sp.]